MMKKTAILFFIFISGFMLGQQVNQTQKNNDGKLMLLGKTDEKAFNDKEFSWYQKNYKNYITNDGVINNFKDSLKNYSIKVFFGTWCGDSKRELPAFYKVINKAKFNKNKLEVIAVDRKIAAYKQSPTGEEKGLNIHRVPTFIFYKNNKEVNRIVEYPVQDFERDIQKIVHQENYKPNYIVVEYLNKLLNTKSIEELKKEENQLIPFLAEYTKGSRELNTFGYKLLRSNNTEKALFIFELNTKIYPYKSNVFDSLGELYYTIKDYDKALTNYYKVLTVKPRDTNAMEMINKIQNELNN